LSIFDPKLGMGVYTLKNARLIKPKFGSNMDKPKNPNLGQIWTNPNVGLKCDSKNDS